ncbi:MAG: acyloxyacyl hydrolase [Bacteroidota bacterium]
MKHSLTLFFCFLLAGLCAQKDAPTTKYLLDASPFYGSILLHNPDIAQLITEHPHGFLLGISQKRYGEEEWEGIFGYPDTGFSFLYQNMNNPTLGEHFGLYAHYNFYFFKRNLQLRIGQGVSYNTNPYDAETNFRNSAYGSTLLSTTLLMANYHKEKVFDRFGLQGGITLVHYSNANFKAPNASTNTFAFNLGLTYDLNPSLDKEYIPYTKTKVTEPLRLNAVLRGGINEGDVVGSGQFGFFILSTYADKRLGRLSAIQLGADVFFSYFLKELIRFQANSFPEMAVDADTDFKRVGLFVGHELFINKLSLVSQLGYYVYYPFDFEGRVYQRVGLKRYFGKRAFGSLTLKTHGAAAEAVEFGIGVRL